jgi:hypothetical protein
MRDEQESEFPPTKENNGEPVDPDAVYVLMMGLMDDQGSKTLAPLLRRTHRARAVVSLA